MDTFYILSFTFIALSYPAVWLLELFINHKSERTISAESKLYVILFLFIGFLIGNFFLSKPWEDPEKAAMFGQAGDYFGGMLNPILAFASFIALLYTIRIQSEELRLTRQEVKASVSAQEKSASLLSLQVEQQKLLEEFKAIREMFVTNFMKAESLLIQPVNLSPSIKEQVLSALSHSIEAMQMANHELSDNEKEGRVPFDGVVFMIDLEFNNHEYNSAKAEYFAAAWLVRRDFEMLERITNRLGGMGDGVLISSYANIAAYHCIMGSFVEPLGDLDITDNSNLHRSIVENYKKLNVYSRV